MTQTKEKERTTQTSREGKRGKQYKNSAVHYHRLHVSMYCTCTWFSKQAIHCRQFVCVLQYLLHVSAWMLAEELWSVGQPQTIFNPPFPIFKAGYINFNTCSYSIFVRTYNSMSVCACMFFSKLLQLDASVCISLHSFYMYIIPHCYFL